MFLVKALKENLFFSLTFTFNTKHYIHTFFYTSLQKNVFIKKKSLHRPRIPQGNRNFTKRICLCIGCNSQLVPIIFAEVFGESKI